MFGVCSHICKIGKNVYHVYHVIYIYSLELILNQIKGNGVHHLTNISADGFCGHKLSSSDLHLESNNQNQPRELGNQKKHPTESDRVPCKDTSWKGCLYVPPPKSSWWLSAPMLPSVLPHGAHGAFAAHAFAHASHPHAAFAHHATLAHHAHTTAHATTHTATHATHATHAAAHATTHAISWEASKKVVVECSWDDLSTFCLFWKTHGHLWIGTCCGVQYAKSAMARLYYMRCPLAIYSVNGKIMKIFHLYLYQIINTWFLRCQTCCFLLSIKALIWTLSRNHQDLIHRTKIKEAWRKLS